MPFPLLPLELPLSPTLLPLSPTTSAVETTASLSAEGASSEVAVSSAPLSTSQQDLAVVSGTSMSQPAATSPTLIPITDPLSETSTTTTTTATVVGTSMTPFAPKSVFPFPFPFPLAPLPFPVSPLPAGSAGTGSSPVVPINAQAAMTFATAAAAAAAMATTAGGAPGGAPGGNPSAGTGLAADRPLLTALQLSPLLFPPLPLNFFLPSPSPGVGPVWVKYEADGEPIKLMMRIDGTLDLHDLKEMALPKIRPDEVTLMGNVAVWKGSRRLKPETKIDDRLLEGVTAEKPLMIKRVRGQGGRRKRRPSNDSEVQTNETHDVASPTMSDDSSSWSLLALAPPSSTLGAMPTIPPMSSPPSSLTSSSMDGTNQEVPRSASRQHRRHYPYIRKDKALGKRKEKQETRVPRPQTPPAQFRGQLLTFDDMDSTLPGNPDAGVLVFEGESVDPSHFRW
ncbi:hypothetical protein HK102_004013 [Quaeritorhiza haematococci]|nr:hypothetical protein HK102_004013 [Quaeritorhiza haematococci]